MAEATLTRSVAAVGIVVHDLDRAVDFYTSIIGMQQAQRIDVPDMNLVEVIMVFPPGRGAAVVLMQYTDAEDRSFKDDGSKLVLQVGDCVAVAEAARAAGHEVTREPAEYPGFGKIAFVKDPDGHTLELLGGAVDS
jgi:lactoylglutathione lyase